MVQKIIGLGVPDKGNGDPLRTAFSKVNENFTELYNSVSVVVTGATAPTSPGVGDLWWDTESGRMYVYYGTSWVDASPVDGAGISSTNQLVNGGNTVSLGSDGKLTLPNGAKITPIAFDGINLEIGTKIWNFDADGDLVLPSGGTIRDSVSGDDLLVDLGDWAFRNDIMYSLNGGVIENSDTTHGATSGLTIPTNGDDSPIVLTNTYGNVVLVSGVNAGSTVAWTFNNSGTITTPLLLPRTFTAVLDDAHRTVGNAISGTPWQYTVAFVVGPGGAVETQIDNPDWPTNPGYSPGDEFEFTEEDHGIPGFTFAVTINGFSEIPGTGFLVVIGVTPPPEYPSTVSSLGAIKLSANTSDWVFDPNGTLTLPGSLKVSNAPEGSIIGEGGVSINAKNGYQFSAAYQRAEILNPTPGYNANVAGFYLDGNGATIEINTDDTGNSWTFDTTGNLTLPNNAVIRIDGNNVEVGNLNNFNVEAAGVVNIYTATDAVTPFQWQFGDDGSITLPNGTTLESSFNSPTDPVTALRLDSPEGGTAQLFLLVNTNQVLIDNNGVVITGGIGNSWEFGNAGLIFPDATVQTTAYVAPTTGNAVISSQDSITISRNGMTIKITAAGVVQMSFDSVIDIRGRSSINNAGSTTIATPNGDTVIGTWYDISTALALGDQLVSTIMDSSFHNVYRITVLIREQDTTPGVEFTTAYAIIEQIQ